MEIENSIAIIKVLPKIQKAITESIAQIDKNIKNRNVKKYQWAKYLGKLAPYKDRPDMNKIYQSFLELKKGNILKALDLVKSLNINNN